MEVDTSVEECECGRTKLSYRHACTLSHFHTALKDLHLRVYFHKLTLPHIHTSTLLWKCESVEVSQWGGMEVCEGMEMWKRKVRLLETGRALLSAGLAVCIAFRAGGHRGKGLGMTSSTLRSQCLKRSGSRSGARIRNPNPGPGRFRSQIRSPDSGSGFGCRVPDLGPGFGCRFGIQIRRFRSSTLVTQARIRVPDSCVPGFGSRIHVFPDVM